MIKYLIIFILYSSIYSQSTNFRFEKISTKEGLNQNTITAILQDTKGYLWFGTPNGLNRYDGYTFKLYKDLTNSNDPYASNNITALAEDKSGNLWIGTATNGISVLNTNTGKFSIIIPDEDAAKTINDIYADSKNNIWVATSGAGLKKYDAKFNLVKSYKYENSPESLSSNRISTIFEDVDGNIWIGTQDAALNKFSIESNKISHVNLNNHSFAITSINQDSEGNIWIGTVLNGIILLDSDSGQVTYYKNEPGNKNSLSQNTIHTIFKDSQNRFWIGTDFGLSLYYPNKNAFFNIYKDPADPASLSSDQILCIYEDRSGIMWLGTNKDGLNRFSRSFAVFNNYYHNPQKENSLISDTIWDITEIAPGKIWLGTDGGLTFWDMNTNSIKHYEASEGSLNHNIIRVVHPYKKGKLLIGTNGGGINIFDIKTGKCKYYTYSKEPGSISDNYIRDFYKNEDGTYWVATMGGLNLFDPETEKFTHFKNIPGNERSLADNRILEIIKDNSGRLYLATYDGLSVFNPEIQLFTNYKNDPANKNSISHNELITVFYSENSPNEIWMGTESGLNKLDIKTKDITRYLQDGDTENNVIYFILEDDEGYFWLGTNRGISRFDKKTAKFKNFDQNDGIRNDEFNAGSYAKLSDGSLMMGGVSGITHFLPSEIQRNDNIPNIVITSFKKYDQSFSVDSLVALDKTLVIESGDQFISFEFAALDFTNSSHNQYKYMLEGFDKHWIIAGKRRYANYTNLDGGNYIFKVKGSNNDGVWNDKGTQLKIEVIPPFWRTIWFQIAVVIILSLLIFYFYRFRVSIMRRQRHELQKEVAIQTKELYRTNMDLKNKQKENDSILNNVEEGFFILNKDLKIRSQFSKALLNILEIESPSNKSILDIIERFLPDKQFTLITDYLDLIFDADLDEDLIKDLNPIHRTEFNFIKDYETRVKYLTFKFKRIIEHDHVSMLIVTVIDETKEYLLAQKLEENEAKAKKQIEWIMGILHLDSKLLNEFMSTSYDEISSIEVLLQTSHKENEYVKVLEEIICSLLILRENANLLDLKFFAQSVHEIEEKAIEIQSRELINGLDFLPLVLHLKELKNNLDELKSLVTRLTNFNTQNAGKNNTIGDESIIGSMTNLIKRISSELEKDVQIKSDNFKSELVPPQYKMLLKNILIQLVRNSLSHGIETCDIRKALLKNKKGTITINNEIKNNTFIVQYEDDGQGLQLEKLKEKALKSNLWAESEINEWNKDQLANVIFTPGISSAEKSDLISGRGIGMDIIQKQLQKHKGQIKIDFAESKYCAFTIELPLTNEN